MKIFAAITILTLLTACGEQSNQDAFIDDNQSSTSVSIPVTTAPLELPIAIKRLNVNPAYTGAGVTIANAGDSFRYPSAYWSSVTTLDPNTGGVLASESSATARHGNLTTSAMVGNRWGLMGLSQQSTPSESLWGISPEVDLFLVGHKQTNSIFIGGQELYENVEQWDVASVSRRYGGDDYTTAVHAINKLVLNGRNGLGSIVFQGQGNDYSGDTCSFADSSETRSYDLNHQLSCSRNWAAQANPYSIGVGIVAIDSTVKASYSDASASLFTMGVEGQWLRTPSNNALISIQERGTSFASPQLAAITAQMLEANPSLNWLDVREIIATASRVIDAGLEPYHTTMSDGVRVQLRDGWITNQAGYSWSRWYGFGLIDATVATSMAATWPSINLDRWIESNWYYSEPLRSTITVGVSTEVVYTIEVTASVSIDSVQVDVDEHYSSGYKNQGITLVSPRGTAIAIRVPGQTEFLDMGMLRAVGFRGEDAQGTWQIRFRKLNDDFDANDDVIDPSIIQGVSLRVFGLAD